MGDHALIKFSSGESGYGPDTYWLVDKENRTIRPFESETALHKAFGNGYDQAIAHTVSVSAPLLDEEGDVVDGILEGYSLLTPDFSIREDGSTKPLEFSNYQLKNRYGRPIDVEAEDQAAEVLDGLLSHLKNQTEQTGIPSSFLEKIRDDKKLMAFYISAIAYGGFPIGRIYQDIQRVHEKQK